MAFDTSVLDRALAQKQTNLEQQRQIVLKKVAHLLESHAKRFGIQRAYIFGSVIRPGRFTETSDIDIAVESIPAEQYFKAVALFSMQLARDVDLVQLNHCHFADKIRREGKLWTALA
jgi:predicted nucleotidyltransferase